MTDWKSQKTQASIVGVGTVLLGLFLGLVGIPVQCNIGTAETNGGNCPSPLRANPFIGLAIVMIGIAILVYVMRQKNTTRSGTAS